MCITSYLTYLLSQNLTHLNQLYIIYYMLIIIHLIIWCELLSSPFFPSPPPPPPWQEYEGARRSVGRPPLRECNWQQQQPSNSPITSKRKNEVSRVMLMLFVYFPASCCSSHCYNDVCFHESSSLASLYSLFPIHSVNMTLPSSMQHLYSTQLNTFWPSHDLLHTHSDPAITSLVS